MTNKSTAITIAVFALVFVIVGWLAPAIYASYAPADHFIEQDSFDPPDVSTEADTHHVCFERTVHRQSSGTVITELYLVPTDGGKTIEVLSRDDERFFQTGNQIIHLHIDLPESAQNEGEYKYQRVYRMELADGRISREFVFESNTFNTSADIPMEPAPHC